MMYVNSLIRHDGCTLFIAKENGVKSLYVFGDGKGCKSLEGEEINLPGGVLKRCPLTNANAEVIRGLFPFTRPVSHKGRKFTIGLGDRLGLASAGHIRLVKELDVFPVLAQQSIRELNLTGRSYDDVLSAAVWAVFQEGYRNGYGADGDHLKTAEEVRMALESGFTMITLDCSEHIGKITDDKLDELYAEIDGSLRTRLEKEYLNQTFNIDDETRLEFTEAELKRTAIVYLGTVIHATSIYNSLLRGKGVDFELSVDETSFTTTPQAHYFVSRELQKNGVEIVSLAPRFCGEFQKGIDYRGDIHAFEKEFKIHAGIAKKLGYKLSVHSGSDKFSVFPIVYRETDRNVHLKTAGTNWLEALRVIAAKAPGLFRKIQAEALLNLAEAKKNYHITEDVNSIPDIDKLPDIELPSLLDQEDARQVLHVTYGFLLERFKDEIFAVLNKHEDEYYEALAKHIGRHLSG